MEENVTHIILKEMPVLTFLVFFGIAIAGAISSFAYSLVKAIQTDTKTPFTFKWKHFWTGAIRTFVSLIIIALAIVEWDKVSSLIFDSESPVLLTAWSAFLLGTLTDRLSEMIFGSSKGAAKKLQSMGTVILIFLILLFLNSF